LSPGVGAEALVVCSRASGGLVREAAIVGRGFGHVAIVGLMPRARARVARTRALVYRARVQPTPDAERRDLMRQAACVAGAWAASTALPVVAAGDDQRHPRSLLVDATGRPWTARQLKVGEAYLFNYPFTVSPVFLLAVEREVKAVELVTEDKQRYTAPAGVGANKSIVAFSAICAHKLVYPTPALSFIGLRKGSGAEPAHVIHCCGDNSRYDPLQGGRVIAGPAPQPLAAVLLEWDDKTDQLHAVGTRGGEMFKAFFDKYAMKLELETGSSMQKPSAASAVVQPASSYSKQWQTCKA
jgi:arsenite oxidase small subunit